MCQKEKKEKKERWIGGEAQNIRKWIRVIIIGVEVWDPPEASLDDLARDWSLEEVINRQDAIG